jgi:hypothetical protein
MSETKTPRTRHVFGKMRHNSFMVRQSHSKKVTEVSFVTLLNRMRLQFELPLQEPLPLKEKKP